MTQLDLWKRGVFLTPRDDPAMRVYLWFYEWHLFDAIAPGEHTKGRYDSEKWISPEHDRARLTLPGLALTATARDNGANLELHVTNESDHDWPEQAAIIPCFNPGRSSEDDAPPNERLFDDDHQRTFFPASEGLNLLIDREIHWNQQWREQVAALGRPDEDDGPFVFSFKWPESDVDATGGLLTRESTDGKWVAGIAWERFLSCQGHNPWRCMHLSVRVGPLKRGESRVVSGRVYLFPGTAEDCLTRYREEFGAE